MNKFRTSTQLLTIVLLLAGPWSLFAQQNWSSFQNGGNLQNDSWKLPTQWTPEKGIQWEVKLAGYGQSTPVLSDDTVYVTSVTGDNKETLNVEAFNSNDGTQRWIYKHPNSSPEKNTVMVSRAAPSPVADANGVIAFFEGGNLVALDSEGKLRWKRDLKAEFGELKARHGLAASLEQNEDHIFVWCERMEAPFLLAISKSTGKTAWKSEGLGATSWSSPRLMQVNGEQHLVLSAMGIIAGLNPANGEKFWEFKQISGNSSATPVPVSDGKFLIGSIGSREGTANSPSCGVISVKKTETGYSVNWEWNAGQTSCSFGSPFAYDNKAYFVNRTGIVICHDIQSGKVIFKERLPAGQIWATPLATKDQIYFFGKNGETTIIQSADSLKVVSQNQLWQEAPKPETNSQNPASPFSGSVLYAAAVSNSNLLLRRGDVLYCVKSK